MPWIRDTRNRPVLAIDKQNVKLAFKRAVRFGLVSSSNFAIKEYINLSGMKRNTTPEPFDLPDHIGNISPSILIGSLTPVVLVRSKKVQDFINSGPSREKAVLQVGLVGGLAVGMLANAVPELGIVFPKTGLDINDFLWGAVASASCSLLMARGYLSEKLPETLLGRLNQFKDFVLAKVKPSNVPIDSDSKIHELNELNDLKPLTKDRALHGEQSLSLEKTFDLSD